MATQLDPKELDVRYVMAQIDQSLQEAARARAETDQRYAEHLKIVAEQRQINDETKFMPWRVAFQAMLATAALIGAGAAIAKLFFP